MRITLLFSALAFSVLPAIGNTAVEGTVYETCPDSADVGNNISCYPLNFTAKTEIHPEGIPLIAYLFVPKDLPPEPVPAIVFAHGCSGMYSSGVHNKGLNSKHQQWVRQYTSEAGYVSLHVSSFHSRYLLPDTDGDQQIHDPEEIPAGTPGGDDYLATNGGDSTLDPEVSEWKECGNGGSGISDVIERPYDADAAWDFLTGTIEGSAITANVRNDRDDRPTLATTATTTGLIGELVPGLQIDPAQTFFYGTSHGGQTAMTTSHEPRATSLDNPQGPGKRYAAFFDYYGGCGLFGAYGGADSDSTWRPYAPFLMLHGSEDSIWKDSESGTIRDQWHASKCKPRIDMAKADPDFDQFLEAIVYKDTRHSFDGVERSDIGSSGVDDADYPDWMAKIHANYVVTLPFMEAIDRIVAAERAGGEVPTLADFGFTTDHPWFSTFPLEPMTPPLPIKLERTREIDNLAAASIDFGQQFSDLGEFHGMTCTLQDEPAGVALNSLDGCVVEFGYDATAISSGIDDHFWLLLETPATVGGKTFLPINMTNTAGESNGLMTLGQPFHTVPDGAVLETNASSGVVADLRGLVWNSMLDVGNRKLEAWPGATFSSAYAIQAPTTLVGPFPAAQTPFAVYSVNHRNAINTGFDLADAGNSYASLTVTTTGVETPQSFSETELIPGETDPDSDPGDTTPDSLAFTQASLQVDEAAGTVTVTVTRDGEGIGAASVNYTSSTGGADGNDFTGVSGLLEWADGETTDKSFVIDILDDDNDESDESFSITLSDPVNASLASPHAIVITILDNDEPADDNQPPAADAGPDQNVIEGESVVLDARGSSDPDDDALNFAWVQTGGSNVTLVANGDGTASFTAPEVASTSQLTFMVTVDDGNGGSDTDTVAVTVNPESDDGDSGGGKSKGGGGALLWLLPLVAVFRRTCR